MENKIKFICMSIILFSASSMGQSFSSICKGNGEYYPNEKITSLISMTGESSGNPKKLYIYTERHGQTEVFASKDFRYADKADMMLFDNVKTAYISGAYVELCVTGGLVLYGIRLK
ncbi:hypothetical protein V5L74_004674 [Enterobacter hormaechei]